MSARVESREFVRDQQAGVTVEFVVLMPAFLLLTLFVLEIAIAIFWVGTAEKAAQFGARLAVVSNYAASRNYAGAAVTESTRYALEAGHVFGDNCNTDACVPFETMTCTGGTGGDCKAEPCVGDPDNRTCFQVIADRIRSPNYPNPAYRGLMSSIQNDNITISYSYIKLGYAGGPLVPSVTVRIAGVPYPTVITSIVSRLFAFILGAAAPPGLTTLPPITVTITGEDQSTAGVIGT
jgi:TadE-like protein